MLEAEVSVRWLKCDWERFTAGVLAKSRECRPVLLVGALSDKHSRLLDESSVAATACKRRETA
jgi:hypothetical protein